MRIRVYIGIEGDECLPKAFQKGLPDHLKGKIAHRKRVRSSAILYSIIETARANDHHPQRYLSVLLAELPNMKDVDGVESLLPWNISPEEVARRYALYPAPGL